LSIDSDCRSQEDNRAFRDADPASWRRDPVGRRAGGRPAWPSSDKPSTPRREQDEVLSTCRLARSRIDVLVVADRVCRPARGGHHSMEGTAQVPGGTALGQARSWRCGRKRTNREMAVSQRGDPGDVKPFGGGPIAVSTMPRRRSAYVSTRSVA
jgi:hypothetical protein